MGARKAAEGNGPREERDVVTVVAGILQREGRLLILSLEATSLWYSWARENDRPSNSHKPG
jgi:hypothetical protein